MKSAAVVRLAPARRRRKQAQAAAQRRAERAAIKVFRAGIEAAVVAAAAAMREHGQAVLEEAACALLDAAAQTGDPTEHAMAAAIGSGLLRAAAELALERQRAGDPAPIREPAG
jgi:hypothetical protein